MEFDLRLNMSRLMFVFGTMSLFLMSVNVKRIPVVLLLDETVSVLLAVTPVRKKPEMLSGMIR